jgi:hypothetical protein
LKSEKIETVKTVESIAISDVVDCGMDVIELELVVAERRPNMQLEEAIKTQNSAFIIAEAATILSQGYEAVSEDVASPSQGVVVSKPGKGVDNTKDQTEETPSNVNMAREIESNLRSVTKECSKFGFHHYRDSNNPLSGLRGCTRRCSSKTYYLNIRVEVCRYCCHSSPHFPRRKTYKAQV